MKKYMWLIGCFVLCVSLACLSFTVFADGTAESDELVKSSFEAKIYSDATLEDDFDDSSVLVIMDRSTGGINKQHEKEAAMTLRKIANLL